MILRTPPPKKRRSDESTLPGTPNSDQPLVIFEDLPLPEPSHNHDHGNSDQMLCTYQCRQMVKSDFFDALDSAEKQAHDCQSRLESLNEDFGKTEAERKKFREQLLYVEQELAASKGREHAMQEQILKEINDSQEQLKKQLQANNELEVKLKKEQNGFRKAESRAISAEEKAALFEGKLGQLSESIEREKKQLNNELLLLKQESKLSVSRISADLERMEFRARNAEEESQLLKEQFEELQKQLNECIHQKSELERRISNFPVQEVSSSDNGILVKNLQEELQNFESEVREARKLKSSQENIELLKEKLLEEKGRKERAESELYKLSDVQISMTKLEDELSSWKLMLKDIPGVSSAQDIPLKFAALQKEVVESMVKEGEANARLKQIEVSLDAAELRKQNAEAEAALAKDREQISQSEVKRMTAFVSSVTEERDQLRSVLNELKKQKSLEAGNDVTNATVVQELESSLAKKEDWIKELESNLYEQKEINNHQHNEIRLLNERLSNEARRIKSLEREGDRLRSEISLLESKLGHGDFSSASTKVLRMANNLAVDNEAKQIIEALENELRKTKEKLQGVEELKKQSGDTGKLVDISGKIMQYKEQIATLEKREERYKAVFADRISVFRRACCELFGYKIVMDDHQRSDGIAVTRFILQSIYAQSDDEKLEFEYESGNTNILENSYTSLREISQQVEIFIRKLNSVPAFTANLTIESFNKRTLS